MNCTICGKPVVLVPSAKERAKTYGETPAFYTNLFKSHAECQIRKRNEDTAELMKRTKTCSTT